MLTSLAMHCILLPARTELTRLTRTRLSLATTHHHRACGSACVAHEHSCPLDHGSYHDRCQARCPNEKYMAIRPTHGLV
ncbi:hypothetical protein M3J09_007829 [Ascochyta lentis]